MVTLPFYLQLIKPDNDRDHHDDIDEITQPCMLFDAEFPEERHLQPRHIEQFENNEQVEKVFPESFDEESEFEGIGGHSCKAEQHENHVDPFPYSADFQVCRGEGDIDVDKKEKNAVNSKKHSAPEKEH
jgi:hypothetical protein